MLREPLGRDAKGHYKTSHYDNHSVFPFPQTLDTCPAREHIKLTQMFLFSLFRLEFDGQFLQFVTQNLSIANANENGFWHRASGRNVNANRMNACMSGNYYLFLDK